jgi:plasmid stabilization system protein ParE
MKGIRMLVEGSYLIFYTIDGANVTIARVLHGARDIESEFNE